MDALLLIGRILFGLTYIMPGISVQLIGRKQATEMARAAGAPFPEVMVPFSGLAIVIGGLSVALGVWADLGAVILGSYVLIIAPIMHAFWKEENEMLRANHMGHFGKNVGLAAGAVFLFYILNQLQGDVGLTLTNPAFHRF
jgi:putative oxidoreductase